MEHERFVKMKCGHLRAISQSGEYRPEVLEWIIIRMAAIVCRDCEEEKE